MTVTWSCYLIVLFILGHYTAKDAVLTVNQVFRLGRSVTYMAHQYAQHRFMLWREVPLRPRIHASQTATRVQPCKVGHSTNFGLVVA